MSFSAATPNVLALSSAATLASPSSLSNFGPGIIAHVAIQTQYRLEHKGNYIITERSIWIGDDKASTVSKILDKLDRLVSLGKAAVEGAGGGLVPHIASTAWENLYVALTYLIDISTMEGVAGEVIRKRYDIIDFGPVAISMASTERFGEAYEIKPVGGAKEGRQYIGQQVKKYNHTLGKLKTALESGLGIPGLLGGYRLRPGQRWPPARRTLNCGLLVLDYWLEEPGLILYEWILFKPKLPVQLWILIMEVQRDLRKAFDTRSSLRPEIVLALATLTVVTVITLAVVFREALISAASAVDAALPSLAQSVAVGGVLTTASAAAAPSSHKDETGGSKVQAARVNEVLAAFQKMEEPDLSFLTQSYRPAAPSSEGPSAGTPQVPYEQSLFRMVDTLVYETMSLYSVHVGQGEEALNAYNLSILQANLTDFIHSFISAYGLKNFLALMGQTDSEELDEVTAHEIAEVIIAVAHGNLESTVFGRFLADFFSLSVEDVKASLPIGCNADGE